MASSYTAASVLPMAPAPMEVQMQRPSMRRKSSAQNLLSSFKSNNTPQQPYPPTTVSSATGLPFVQSQQQASGFQNSRDWDVQSQTETLASTTPILGSNGATAPVPQGNLVEMLREVVKKRVITLTYLRNVHEGCVLVFSLSYHSRSGDTLCQAEPLVSHHHDYPQRIRPNIQ